LHTETHRGAVFNLEAAKSGIKIKQADAPPPPAKEGPVSAAWDDCDGRMIGNKSTMAGCRHRTDHNAADSGGRWTEMKACDTFDAKWRTPEAPDARRRGTELGGDGIACSSRTCAISLGCA
jgi:hypothetical protein